MICNRLLTSKKTAIVVAVRKYGVDCALRIDVLLL